MRKNYSPKLKWPINSEQAEYMRLRKKENIIKAKKNPNEIWMKNILNKTPYKWSWQSTWGYRVFDFWCHYLGIAIEVDGDYHNKQWDKLRDEYNLKHSGILVLRVRNRNLEDMEKVLEYLQNPQNWNERRALYNLRPIKSVTLSSNGSEFSQLDG